MSPHHYEPQAPAGSRGLAAELAAELVAHRAGDRAATGRLARLATPVLWRVARGCGADAMTAEDAVQNGLLALVRRADAIEEPHAVLKWLIVTVRREAVRLRRAAEATDLSPDADADIPAPRDAEPDDVALVHDRDRVLWRAVATLSQRCQQLLRLVAFTERPDYTAVAAALDMRIGSIGPTRGRCLAKLRLALAADPGWSGA